MDTQFLEFLLYTKVSGARDKSFLNTRNVVIFFFFFCLYSCYIASIRMLIHAFISYSFVIIFILFRIFIFVANN